MSYQTHFSCTDPQPAFQRDPGPTEPTPRPDEFSTHGLPQLGSEEDQGHGTYDEQHTQVKVRHEVPPLLEKMLVVSVGATMTEKVPRKLLEGVGGRALVLLNSSTSLPVPPRLRFGPGGSDTMLYLEVATIFRAARTPKAVDQTAQIR